MLTTKEHYDLMSQFEKDFSYLRLDKENKALWRRGRIYENGTANDLFNAYRKGYSLGVFVGEGN